MTYFFTEFLPTVENLYAVKKDRASRAIGGLSMGGFGSLYYGLLHPEMFSYVYACSPATYIDGAPNLYDLLSKADVSKLPGITIEIGTEDFLFQSAGSFKQALDANKVPNEYITRAGTHDWPFWAACTPKIMKSWVKCGNNKIKLKNRYEETTNSCSSAALTFGLFRTASLVRRTDASIS